MIDGNDGMFYSEILLLPLAVHRFSMPPFPRIEVRDTDIDASREIDQYSSYQ